MEQVKNVLEDIVQKLTKRYEFLLFNSDDYYEIVEKTLRECNVDFESDNSIVISSEVEGKINKHFTEVICDKLNDPVESYRIIENYIKLNINSFSKYEDIMKEFLKLECFFDRYNYVPSLEICIKVLENNEVLNQMLSTIVSQNIDEIQSGNIEDISNLVPSLSFFIESFCIKNNIEIKDEEPSDKKTKLLSKEETNELLFRWQHDGDIGARNKILECNLGLISMVAKRYLDRGVERDDLVQEGILGMMRAIDSFDYSTGYRLSTYATWWIAQSIKRFVEDKGKNFKIPVHVQNKLYHYSKIREKLKQQLGREPKVNEIAEEMNLSIEQLKKILSKSREVLSLNYYVGEEENAEFGDFLIDDNLSFENKVIDEDFASRLQLLFKQCKLTEQEIDIIERRLGLKNGNVEVLESIGKSYNLTRERIRQIENRALMKLRKSVHTAQFFGYENVIGNVVSSVGVSKTSSKKKSSSARTYIKATDKRTLMEILNDGEEKYSETEVKNAILELTDEEKNILISRYTPGHRFDSIETGKFYCSILPKIKRIIDNEKNLLI